MSTYKLVSVACVRKIQHLMNNENKINILWNYPMVDRDIALFLT